MVTLPVYDNKVGLSDGAGSLRLRSDNGFEEFGNSVSRFGNAFADAGVQREKADLQIAHFQEVEAKRSAGIDDALTRQDFANTWQKKYQKLVQDMPPSGEGFSDRVEEAFNEHVESYRGQFSGIRDKENMTLLAQYKTQQLGHAIQLEATTRANTTKALADGDFKGFNAIAAETGPAGMGVIMKQAELKAASLNLEPNQRAAYLREARLNAEKGAVAWAMKYRPLDVLRASNGVFGGVPVQGAPEEVQKIANGAAASGGDLQLLLATGHLESKFDPGAKPIGPDGKPMSSAAGVFQTLDGAYGLGKDKSTEAQARALGAYYEQAREKLTNVGINPTPGAMYMFHNVGDGLALNILRARPDEKMSDIVARTYPSRPELAAKVLANNPGLYRADSTAGDVIANYEGKMSGAITATSKYITADGKTSPDDKARSAFSSVLGMDVQELSVGELKDATDLVRKDLAKNGKKAASLELGLAIHTGQVRADPYSKEDMKHLDAFAATTGLAEGVLKGDDNAFVEVRKSVKSAGKLAAPYAHAIRELIVSGDNSPAQAKAFEMMASISREDPGSWDASGLTDIVKSRVKEYRALTDSSGSIVTPAEAIKRINFEATADGKANIKAVRELFKETKDEELKKLNVGDALSAISKGYWRNGELFDPSSKTGTSDTQQRVLLDNYRVAYTGYRQQGKDAETSNKLALQDLSESYGISNVGRSGTFRGEVTRFPIEAKYPAIDAKRPHQWINEQIENRVSSWFKERDPTSEDIPWANSRPEVRLLPTDQTRSDWASGRAPAYALAVRNPKTGLVEVVDPNWRPDPVDAQRKHDEDFLKTAESARASKPPTWSATGPSNYKLPSLWKVK